MPTLRADDNRYLLQAEPWERARVRRIPGARWLPDRQLWQLPLRDGVILALDRVFGAGGWAPDESAEFDTEAARGRIFDPPREKATATLDGTQLAVTCDIGDRELVKLVPGYRWSPANKTWYVPGVPLALELLRHYFGDYLQVDDDTISTLELRALDEQRDIEKDRALFEQRQEEERRRAEAPPPPEIEAPGPPLGWGRDVREELERAEARAAASSADPVVDRLERIDATLLRLEALFERMADALTNGAVVSQASAMAPPLADEPGEAEPDDALADWRAILAQSQEAPEAALDQASRLLQTTSGSARRELRAVAGVAAHRAGREQQAYEHLSQALRHSAELEDPDLTRVTRDAYQAVTLRFLNEDTGPLEPIENDSTLRRLLLAELQNGKGFDDAGIGSASARGTLERLVADPALKAISPDLADFCRVAHLLSVVRGGSRMAAGLVADVLREEGLHPDAQALVTILYTNVLLDVASVDEWIGGWPRELGEEIQDPGALVDSALATLPLVDRELAGPAALATLAATALAEEIPLNQRRKLLAFIHQGGGARGYGEFLSVFRLAATGGRANWEQFPGYVRIVGERALAQSWPHLHEVFMASGGKDGPVRALADGAYLHALEAQGITDPQTQVIDLLGLLDAGSRPDNLLNKVGRLVEEGGFPGADQLNREQRTTVYRAALAAAIRMGHDEDAREAFHRLVRALQVEPDGGAALRELCAECLGSIRPLHAPALVTQLESLLGEGAPVEDVLSLVERSLRSGAWGDDATAMEAALTGLQFAFPVLRKRTLELLERNDIAPTEEPEPVFEGARVVVVGGHPGMRKHVEPTLRGWQVDVDWLDADAARTGAQAKALASGSADFVVVNTSYIGHAASGRVREAAEGAGTVVVENDATGVGTTLHRIWTSLRDLGERPAATKQRKTDRLKRHVRR